MGALLKLLLGTAAIGLNVLVGCAAPGFVLFPAAELDARSLGYASASLSRSDFRVSALREVVLAANTALNQSPAAKILSHRRVRLQFANGGWVEFEPRSGAIASDSLPPLLAIQFARASS